MIYKHYATQDTNGSYVYRCHHCEYDTYQESAILLHEFQHRDISTPPEWTNWLASENSKMLLKYYRIGIIFLSFNDGPTIAETSKNLYSEVALLDWLGMEIRIYHVDNSTDDTTYHTHLGLQIHPDYKLFKQNKNIGQSRARNIGIDEAIKDKCNFIAMLDADIWTIPGAFYAMCRAFVDDNAAGCYGMYSNACCPNPSAYVSPCVTQIPSDWVRPRPNIAWTQYGVFAASFFRKGRRFEVDGPFNGPGWGLEDDDLYMQMLEDNYTSKNVRGYCYRHLRNSSISRVSDVAQIFEQRRQFLFEKWAGNTNPQIARHLSSLRTLRVPVLH